MLASTGTGAAVGLILVAAVLLVAPPIAMAVASRRVRAQEARWASRVVGAPAVERGDPRSMEVRGEDGPSLQLLGSVVLRDRYLRADEVPGLRSRRGPLALLLGDTASGVLTISRAGLSLRCRRWPFSIGVRGTMVLPWDGVDEVTVGEPLGATGASGLGGTIWITRACVPEHRLCVEFFGPPLAVEAELRTVGAPVGLG